MSREKNMIKNSIIISLGQICTKFITFFMLPFYTHYLTTSEYGIVDLLQTIISLLIPIFFLQLEFAVFRYLIDYRNNDNEKNNVISTSFIFSLFLSLIYLIIFFIITYFFSIDYKYFLLFNVIVTMFSSLLLQICRGLGDNVSYSIGCLITGISTVLLNIIFIACFRMGIIGMLFSILLANLFSFIFLFIRKRVFSSLVKGKFSLDLLKKMLIYSIPLIPNQLSWWIVNTSDRTIITSFLGSSINGIYSVSCKFSNILNSFFSVFSMSWQESASLHIDDEDKDIFFTNMINKLFFTFASISLIIVVSMPFLFKILIGSKFIESYKYMPLILFANVLNVLISLIGGIYVAKKKSKEIANTTIISAIINIAINLIFIKYIGLYAACISTIIAYLTIAIYRYKDCQKYVKVKLDIKSIIIFTIIFIISSILYYINNIWLNILNLCIVFIYSITLNKELILETINIIKRKLIHN